MLRVEALMGASRAGRSAPSDGSRMTSTAAMTLSTPLNSCVTNSSSLRRGARERAFRLERALRACVREARALLA